MSIKNLVENKTKLDYQAIATSLISEFGISDPINWDAVIPANVQHNLFGGETLRLFDDHPNFATQKDIRTISLKKGQTSQLLVLFAKLKDERLSKSNIEKVTKKFIGGSAAERFVVWFLGNPSNTEFKVVLSGREGKKIVLKTLPFGINQPYYKTYDFILEEVHKKVAQLFVEPNELWKALWKSFDISVVNKKFYLDIKSAFDSLINDKVFRGSIRIEEARKQFAVRLIGRIIFSWFLKKKNIISETVLSSNAISKYDNYYLGFLEKLFFEVFNTPQKERGKLPDEIKDYPFLNGGLFEAQEGDYGDYKGKVIIANDWFIDLFKNTLEKYNFTIDENTSASSEIAIDPEMLGRIFENLLAEQNPETQESARKSTGSYYTPREIVDYMVEQSISEYLKSNVTLGLSKGEATDVIANQVKQSFEQDLEDFVHTEEFPDTLKQYSTQIFEKLNFVKILDPACGSGAFPIGMLQKLIALKLQLTSPFTKGGTQGGLKGVSVYDLKLQTILNSIYGCDIQPMAVELSRLRCWLSLIIDEDVDKKKSNWGIANLPNLDFKFVCVNTLLGLPQMIQDSLGTSADDFEKLKQLREEFFTASAKRKLQIEKDFKSLQDNIAEKQREWSTKNTEAVTMLINWEPFKVVETNWFDSFWMFGIADGFDIVIGNPPYGIVKSTNTSKEILKNYLKYHSAAFKVNLYALFLEKGLLLTKSNGSNSFIIPDSSLNLPAFKKLRNYILNNSGLKFIAHFREEIFENASVGKSVILQYTKNSKANSFLFRTFDSIQSYKENLILLERVLKDNDFKFVYNSGESGSEALLDKLKSIKTKLQNYCDVYDGINPGSEEIKNSVISENRIDKDSKKIIDGKCFSRYSSIDWEGFYVYYNSDFVESLRRKIEKRGESFTGRIIKRTNFFEYPKIVTRQTAETIIGTLDTEKYYVKNSVHSTLIKNSFRNSVSLEMVLAILNSKLIDWYYRTESLESGRLFPQVKIERLRNLPFIIITDQTQLKHLVDKLLSIKRNNLQASTKELEDKIDVMVYKLYNLTYEEVKIIDPEIEKIISKEDYGKFEIS